ncbi:MAG: glycerol-3-phosphate acyltransferase [Acidimicrobiaceae bacterium]|nr:glycerol-3-phosphate acyltransferase [Acidimicrobiaceae bacterium]
MIVLVEAVALEGDPHLGEDPLDGRSALPVLIVMHLGAAGQGLVAKRLPKLKHLSGPLAPVVVGGHENGGYPYRRRSPPYDGRVIEVVALVVGAYIVGMFPTAAIVGRRLGVDPTREGSGNPGASNIYRLASRRAGVIVGLIDMGKGAAPAALALLVSGRPAAHAVWVAAVLGHVWPALRGFRGGKGVATAGGAGLMISPVIGLLCGLTFLVVVKVLRVAALGSLSIAFSYPLLAAIAGLPAWEILVSVGVAAILVVRHQSNIRRLLSQR